MVKVQLQNSCDDKSSLNHKPQNLTQSAYCAPQHRSNCYQFTPFGLYLYLCVLSNRSGEQVHVYIGVFPVSLHVTGGDCAQPVYKPQRLPLEYLQQWRADEAGGLQSTTFAPNHTLCWLRHHPTTSMSFCKSNIYLLHCLQPVVESNQVNLLTVLEYSFEVFLFYLSISIFCYFIFWVHCNYLITILSSDFSESDNRKCSIIIIFY